MRFADVISLGEKPSKVFSEYAFWLPLEIDTALSINITNFNNTVLSETEKRAVFHSSQFSYNGSN